MSHTQAVVYGQMRAAGIPEYWRTADVPQDGATAVAFRVESLPFMGMAGGEHLFREIVLAGRHSLGGSFRVDAIVNGEASPVASATIDGVTFTVETLPGFFTLVIPPSMASVPEARDFSVVVPLVRRLLINTVETARWYLRGESLAVRVTPVGPLSAGQLLVDGATLDHDEMRRADNTLTAAVTV